jgi:hypothetical protein
MLTIRQEGHSEVRTLVIARLPVLRMAVLITSMVTAVASTRIVVMTEEEEWEDEGEDWVLSQVALRRMNGTIGMMFDNSSSSNKEEWEQDSVGMDITAMLAHCHVLVVVDMVLVRGGVAVVSVVVHSRQICDDNNKSNNQE